MKMIINNQIGKKIMYNSHLISNAHYGEQTPPVADKNYFYCYNNSENTCKIYLYKLSAIAPTVTVQYSTDKTTWQTWGTTSTTRMNMTLNARQKVYFRAQTNTWSRRTSVTDTLGRHIFCTTNTIGGNVMSLIYGANFTGQETVFPENSKYNFDALFGFDDRSDLYPSDKTMLIDASELILPAVSLTEGCYYRMFERQTNLAYPPALPATTLATNCYYEMFISVKGMTTAPDLNAATIPDNAYYSMFYNATNLSNIKCTAVSGQNTNTQYWTWNLPANGTFTKTANTTWSTGEHGIPNGWTVIEI